MTILPTSYPLAAIVASAFAILCLPCLRRRNGYLTLSLLVASVVYRHQFFGYLLWIVLLFAFAGVVERLEPPRAKGVKKRWMYSCGAMLAVIAIFFAGRMRLLDDGSIRAFGILRILPDHDMWLLVRTISFLWEFGSGRLKKLGFVEYVIWITFPFTLLGSLIRPNEFFSQYGSSTSQQAVRGVIDRNWWRKLSLAIAQMITSTWLARATN